MHTISGIPNSPSAAPPHPSPPLPFFLTGTILVNYNTECHRAVGRQWRQGNGFNTARWKGGQNWEGGKIDRDKSRFRASR
jgi:hypothetical protein